MEIRGCVVGGKQAVVGRLGRPLRDRVLTKKAASHYFQSVAGGSSFRDNSDLFKFRFVQTKESRHLDDLIGIYEILWLVTELAHAGSKLPALHCFRNFQADAACALLRVMQTEIANSHISFLTKLRAFHTGSLILHDAAETNEHCWSFAQE